MAVGLMLVSTYAFSRAGFGHASFRGARSFGRSSGRHHIHLAIFGIAMAYEALKICIKKLIAPRSPNKKRIINNTVYDEIDLLYKQNEINMNPPQLKHLFSDIYISLQQAWMKQDLSEASQVLSEQLIQDLDKPLNSLKKRQLADYIRDIEFHQIEFLKVSKVKNSRVIRVQLSGLMIDERVSLSELSSMSKKTFSKKEFSDIMEFSYSPDYGWKVVYLKVR